MKKILFGLIVVFFAFWLCSDVFCATVTVRSKDSKVRTQPKFYAPAVATVIRGDWLDQTGKQGDWIKVKTSSGATGWIHSSACVLKKINLSKAEGMGRGEISADEAALAGKGFNPVVESKYRQEHPKLDYSLLDKIESFKISEDELVEFMKEGRLGEFGGGK